MRVKFKHVELTCGCGGKIHELPRDWIRHYKYRGFWRTIRLVLLTKIQLKRGQ